MNKLNLFPARNGQTAKQKADIITMPQEPKISIRYCLFIVIPVLKTTQHYGVTRWLLFGFLPILKIKHDQEKIKSYLFGVIPFTRTSDKYGVFKLRVFGIPVIRKKHN